MNSQAEDASPTLRDVGSSSSTPLFSSSSEEDLTHKKIPRHQLTEDQVKRIREERAKKRQSHRNSLISQGKDPDFPTPDLQFIKRPFLHLHHEMTHDSAELTLDSTTSSAQTTPNSLDVKIMTYNTLAQTLIRRNFFPQSGSALKWHKRSKVLVHELKTYNPDIVSLQEVDYNELKFWQDNFRKLGFDLSFKRHEGKTHGLLIAWKTEKFQLENEWMLDYDTILAGNVIPARTRTKNIAFIASLRLKNIPGPSTDGIIVANTHLFWHPFGVFERLRQSYLVLAKIQEIKACPKYNEWHSVLMGDFNTEPEEPPYLAITRKPVTLRGPARVMAECSLAYRYSKKRNGEGSSQDDEECDEQSRGEGRFNQPQNPKPKSFPATSEQKGLVNQLVALHNSLHVKGVSLYGLGYGKVQPENSHESNGEPELSNWANSWCGLLDYIFYIEPSDEQSTHEENPLDDFENKNNLRVIGYLKMPRAKEMPKHSQPFEGEYASDHVSLMCQLRFLSEEKLNSIN
ncbi:3'-5' poly(A) RNA exonuclease [Saccharomyces eubayanus]|uniref:3'-5' poly(A) RNA exonuclease n=1 Tax=Saccharomyces eubayanus TaxID=1080349 RepID=UPI0006C5FE14|nr:NGL3-like protein [Saccharomyces eubayanus]KOG97237.1 NGL3-like protein [Saccharomyces eubayanus]